MRDVFIRQLTSLAGSDPRIMLITGDLGFGVLDDFAARFPRQYLNAGVAEQSMTGLAAGMALSGKIVFTYSIANFPTLRCLEQIRNDAAYHGADVKVVAIGGGFSYGALGISHHATEDIAILRALPDVTVVAPGDDWEAAAATRAIAYHSGTCYLRLDKTSAPHAGIAIQDYELGRARMARDGGDLTLIASGGILSVALTAADELEHRGIACRVLSMHTVKPIDSIAILRAVAETKGIVTVEEHTVFGGLGSAVAEVCMDAGAFPRFFRRMGLRAGFSSMVGSQEYLREHYGLDARAIVETVLSNVSESRGACAYTKNQTFGVNQDAAVSGE